MWKIKDCDSKSWYPAPKQKCLESFFATSENIDSLNLVELVRKYIELRTENCDCVCFFFQYKAGKYTKQPIGINSISNVLNLIARYHKLPNPNAYTGHYFRQSSTSLLYLKVTPKLLLKTRNKWLWRFYMKTKIFPQHPKLFHQHLKIIVHTQKISTYSSKSLGMSAFGINLSNCKDLLSMYWINI